jgi:hypothetical protein
MKPSYSLAFAIALALTASSSFAVPPAKDAPAETTTPASKDKLTDKQKVGRFFVGTGRAIGNGVKKTGQFLGRGIDKMVEKGAPKEKAKP